ncbi:MAG: hypothetical protein AAF386_04835 [Pseudomonadota bacterium]
MNQSQKYFAAAKRPTALDQAPSGCISAADGGLCARPFGLALCVDAGATTEPKPKIAIQAVPFVLCMFAVVLLIVNLPALSDTLLPEIYK